VVLTRSGHSEPHGQALNIFSTHFHLVYSAYNLGKKKLLSITSKRPNHINSPKYFHRLNCSHQHFILVPLSDTTLFNSLAPMQECCWESLASIAFCLAIMLFYCWSGLLPCWSTLTYSSLFSRLVLLVCWAQWWVLFFLFHLGLCLFTLLYFLAQRRCWYVETINSILHS